MGNDKKNFDPNKNKATCEVKDNDTVDKVTGNEQLDITDKMQTGKVDLRKYWNAKDKIKI